MKNNFLVFVSLFVSLNMLSQSMTNDQTLDNDYLSSKTTPVFKGYKNTMGSIYANKEFQIGSVYKDGNWRRIRTLLRTVCRAARAVANARHAFLPRVHLRRLLPKSLARPRKSQCEAAAVRVTALEQVITELQEELGDNEGWPAHVGMKLAIVESTRCVSQGCLGI